MKKNHLIKILSSLVKFSYVLMSKPRTTPSNVYKLLSYLREIISFTAKKLALETGASLDKYHACIEYLIYGGSQTIFFPHLFQRLIENYLRLCLLASSADDFAQFGPRSGPTKCQA